MNELLEGLKATHALIAFAVGAPLALLWKWWRLRERAWTFKARRQKRLRELLKEGRWESAQRLDLHAAIEDAFARAIDTSELPLIESRVKPWRLLHDRLRAGHFVKPTTAGDGYEDARSPFWKKRISFAGAANLCITVASIVFPLGGVGAFFGWLNGGPLVGIMCTVWWLMPVVFFFQMSLTFEAANRVVSTTAYPAATDLPKRSKSRSKPSGKKRKDKDVAKKDGKGLPSKVDAAPARAPQEALTHTPSSARDHINGTSPHDRETTAVLPEN